MDDYELIDSPVDDFVLVSYGKGKKGKGALKIYVSGSIDLKPCGINVKNFKTYNLYVSERTRKIKVVLYKTDTGCLVISDNAKAANSLPIRRATRLLDIELPCLVSVGSYSSGKTNLVMNF